MARSPNESPSQAIPDMVAALDLARSAILALEVVDALAERDRARLEVARALRGGESKRPQLLAQRARTKALDGLIDRSRAELALSRLDVPPPVEAAVVLHGRVTDKGAGVADVTVLALDSQDRTLAEQTTDERGQYVLEIPGREPIAVRLEVRKGRAVVAGEKRTTRLTPGLVTFRGLQIGRR